MLRPLRLIGLSITITLSANLLNEHVSASSNQRWRSAPDDFNDHVEVNMRGREKPPSNQRHMTVEDLFRLEEIGDTTLSPDGKWLAYVVRRPKASAAHFKQDFLFGNDRGDIWIVQTDGGTPRNLTKGSDEGAGFWAPSWSPDGQYLAMHSTRGGNVRLWIWNRRDDQLKLATEHGLHAASGSGVGVVSVWLSPTTLLVPVLPAGAKPSSLTIETRAAEAAMREWPKAWKGEATVSILESGGRRNFDDRPQGRLLLLDVSNSTEKVILDGYFRQLQLSPDKRHVVFLRQSGVIQPVPGQMLFTHLGNERDQIGVVSASGQVVSPRLADVRDVLPGSIIWSPDGQSLAFLGYPAESPKSSLTVYEYRPDKQSLDVLTTTRLELTAPTEAGGSRPVLRWSSRGELVLYARSSSSSRWDWWLLPKKQTPENLTGGMKSVPSSLLAVKDTSAFVGIVGGEIVKIDIAKRLSQMLTDRFEPSVSSVVWPTRSGVVADQIVVRARRQNVTEFYIADLMSEGLRPFVAPVPEASLTEFLAKPETGVFRLNSQSGSYLWLSATGQQVSRQLLHLNTFLENIAEGDFRRIEYTSLDGATLSAWLVLPVGYHQGERYPLISWVYAGSSAPAAAPSNARIFTLTPFNLQLLSAHGYAVLIPSMPASPEGRASDPYFELTKGVLPAIDKAIEMGIADPQRLGVMGHSWGGYSTYGLVTQTKRFKAAVALAGPADLVSLYGQFDPRSRYNDHAEEQMFEMSIMEAVMGQPPWQDLARYVRNSPVFYAEQVETPVLIIQGDLDYVPIQQGEEFFLSLYRQNKRAAFVRYWGEGHIIQGPSNTRDMWNRIYAWFDEFLK